MAPITSAGILPYSLGPNGRVRVFIAHMGGPFWAHKDEGAWSICKGQFLEDDEPAEDAARREFAEEVGMPCPDGPLVDLGRVRQAGGKVVVPFAVQVADETALRFVESNLFELEWPPRSGTMAWFPEMDRAEWMDINTARSKILKSQHPILDALIAHVATSN